MMDALEKATAYLNVRPHTAKEVIDYLLRKGYRREESEEAVDQLKEYRFIDDLQFAVMYFEYGFEKGRGKSRIARELAQKGVDRDTIEDAYSQLEQVPDEREIALQIAVQTADQSGMDLNELTYEEKQKLQAKIVRRLAGRGFSGSTCYSVARELIK